ncbi:MULTISPECIES: adhesive domain-containing protein [Enterococcus]|uniref:Bacterial Ig domain-containing protein n=1 Tax=Enterococcus alishanensis TaxID=1303817 RepID=A0ABS6TG25_9ENTE|nr:adhesive domain-containing protein [Enterococcus alishanensis]MBV7391894.1 hypothetical protein [Enterococcus alishanensis]
MNIKEKKAFKLGVVAVASLTFGVATAVPVLSTHTIMAEAAVINGNINEKTDFSTDFPTIASFGSHTGNFTVQNSSLAEFQLILKGNKTAKIQVPSQLAGLVSATGDAGVTVQMGLDLSENIPLIDQFLNTTDEKLRALMQLIDDQSILGWSVNAEEVYNAMDAIGQLRNLDVAATSSAIGVSQDGRVLSAQFDDATVRFIANKINDLVTALQNAINAFQVNNPSFPIMTIIINTIFEPIKKLANGVLGLLPTGANAVADFVKLIGDAAVLKSSSVTFPVAMNTDENWFKTNAPNGLTVDFTGAVDEPEIISFDIFEKQGNNTVPITFADIVAPNAPIVGTVTGTEKAGYSFDVTAESGSIVTVTDKDNKTVATSSAVPGTVDGKTTGRVSFKDLKVDAGSVLTVKATDKAGNISDAATATMPGTKITKVPLYRAYNPNSGEHLYTIDKGEFDGVIAAGWNDEGIAWVSPSQGDTVYRAYNPNSGEHFYTKDATEFAGVVAAGWNDEGIGFYSSTEKDAKYSIYRVFNPNATGPGSHHYTKSESEKNGLVREGWADEAVGFYGIAE